MVRGTDEAGLRALLARQEDVVSRPQLLGLGADDDDIARMLRRRGLVVAVPGVYLAHTGPPTRRQREWIAVLAAWPAALSHDSALPDADGRVLHVAVDRHRGSLLAPEGVRLHRMVDLDSRVAWNRSPPRVRLEQALVDVVGELLAADRTTEAFARLARACHSRQTTPERIADVVASRARVPGRRLLLALLADLADGACSVLERGYLHRVERAHGLPRGVRQRRRSADGRTTYTDVEYPGLGTVVELDGRAFHEDPEARDRDAARDLVNLLAGDLTVRLTFGLVFDRGCATAADLGLLLRARGWTDQTRPCVACRQAA